MANRPHQFSKDRDLLATLHTDEVAETDVDGLHRVKTVLEKSIVAFEDQAASMVKQGEVLRAMEKEAGSGFNAISDHRFNTLKGCLFAGHLATDLDSIAGAIGAAALYNGIAVSCSELNSETRFALKKWRFDPPIKVEDVIRPESRVCLVDFQQSTQLNEAISPKQVVGVIDHHALQVRSRVNLM